QYTAKDGAPLTDSKKFFIDSLMGDLPADLAKTLIDRRKADQRRKSYGLNFIEAIHPVTGKVHPDFTQNCLVTGRVSCSPGLQTIPRNAEYRQGFVAGDGYLLSIVDASQIEARIIADCTEDPVAIEVFNSGSKPDIY